MMTHNKLENQPSQRLRETDRSNKKNLIIGSIIATLVAITPYIFYLYESVPDEKIWDTFLFTFESMYYENANVAIWIMMGKIIPLYLLFIWFFTCRHWWYHVLIIPIAMYVFQFFTIFIDETDFFDQMELMYLIPLMAIIIPSIYLIRAKMFNRLTNQSMQELEDEYRLGPRSIWDKVKDYF